MMQTISVRFFARKDRAIDELIPVTMRIGLNRERINIATKIHVKESEWSSEQGRIITITRQARLKNEQLEAFRIKAFECQRELMNEGKPVTLENIKAKWFGISMEKKVMLMEVFANHNAQMKALINKEFAPLTMERYETSFRHTQAFMRWKYKIDDIDVQQLKYEFIADYEFWLKSVRNCDHNTSMKYLSNFKKIVHICIKNGWLT